MLFLATNRLAKMGIFEKPFYKITTYSTKLSNETVMTILLLLSCHGCQKMYADPNSNVKYQIWYFNLILKGRLKIKEAVISQPLINDNIVHLKSYFSTSCGQEWEPHRLKNQVFLKTSSWLRPWRQLFCESVAGRWSCGLWSSPLPFCLMCRLQWFRGIMGHLIRVVFCSPLLELLTMTTTSEEWQAWGKCVGLWIHKRDTKPYGELSCVLEWYGQVKLDHVENIACRAYQNLHLKKRRVTLWN